LGDGVAHSLLHGPCVVKGVSCVAAFVRVPLDVLAGETEEGGTEEYQKAMDGGGWKGRGGRALGATVLERRLV